MKIKEAINTPHVWYAPKGSGAPREYSVVGHLDLGQSKYITLCASGELIKVKGAMTRSNSWGYDADFAFALTREEWFDAQIESLSKLKDGFNSDQFHFAFGNDQEPVK